MVNAMLSCGRCLKAELLRSEKTARFLQRYASNKNIRIPKRINRGPLDILQTLAGTIKFEPGVTDYRFQYGGLFDSKMDYLRRVVALSMDSGRKAAKWVVTENPKFFQHKYADPYIKAFAPPKTTNENTELSEVTLIGAIEDIEVEEAIKLYKMMKEKNIDISMATKQLLLEMVSYFNGKNKPDEALIETKYFENPKRITLNTWEKNGFAEELFSEMKPNSESYSALILGMFKYNNVRNAMKLYDEAKEKGIEFGVDVYSALLEHVSDKMFEHADQEAYIIELLKEMREKKIMPNLGTLNSTLKSVAAMRKWVKARYLAVKVYQEFKSIGIKPSLATYYYLLEIFADRSRVTPAFNEILNETENKSFIASHPDDFNFFCRAMDIASYNFKSIALSHRVHKLLMNGNNKYFLPNNICCTNYYRAYIAGAFRNGDLDDAMDLFENCVPQAYIPETIGVLVRMILGSLEAKNGSRFLPRIWPLIQNVSLKSEKACNILLSILVEGITLNKDENFLKIAREAWENSKENNILRTSSNLSSFLKIFTLGENKDLSHEVFVKAVTFGVQNTELDFESLNLYTDFCISNDDKRNALMCVEYALTAKHKHANSLAEKVKSKFQLEKDENNFIEELLNKNKGF